MMIRSVEVANVRCLRAFKEEIYAPTVVIRGPNGAGKSSLLEALYYGSYLRSCRTASTREMIAFGEPSFFIRLGLATAHDAHELTVGFSPEKRVIKLNQQTVISHKQLLEYYRVVSLSEDDLIMIKGGPELRRAFIDHALALLNPSVMPFFRRYRAVLENRNELIRRGGGRDPLAQRVWTEQLLQLTYAIAGHRHVLLKALEEQVNHLVQLVQHQIPQAPTIRLRYHLKGVLAGYEPYRAALAGEMLNEGTGAGGLVSSEGDQSRGVQAFMTAFPHLYRDEQASGRSLFGAHLDDIVIEYAGQTSRQYASRGQQKLVLVLLKMALVILIKQQGSTAIFLLDDFVTDFDARTVRALLPLMQGLGVQLFFTEPFFGGHHGESAASHLKNVPVGYAGSADHGNHVGHVGHTGQAVGSLAELLAQGAGASPSQASCAPQVIYLE